MGGACGSWFAAAPVQGDAPPPCRASCSGRACGRCACTPAHAPPMLRRPLVSLASASHPTHTRPRPRCSSWSANPALWSNASVQVGALTHASLCAALSTWNASCDDKRACRTAQWCLPPQSAPPCHPPRSSALDRPAANAAGLPLPSRSGHVGKVVADELVHRLPDTLPLGIPHAHPPLARTALLCRLHPSRSGEGRVRRAGADRGAVGAVRRLLLRSGAACGVRQARRERGQRWGGQQRGGQILSPCCAALHDSWAPAALVAVRPLRGNLECSDDPPETGCWPAWPARLLACALPGCGHACATAFQPSCAAASTFC